jgi:hypothetical protein
MLIMLAVQEYNDIFADKGVYFDEMDAYLLEHPSWTCMIRIFMVGTLNGNWSFL